MSAIDTIREFNKKLRAELERKNGSANIPPFVSDDPRAYRGPLFQVPKWQWELPRNYDDGKHEERENEIKAMSGNNIDFNGYTGLSENYKNALADAIRFYQNEFKITPKSNISRPKSKTFDDPNVGALVNFYDVDDEERRRTEFRYLRKRDEDTDLAQNDLAQLTEWHPKNAKTLSNNAVHEFGHVLTDMLFPEISGTYSNDKTRRENYYKYSKLYEQALHDVGARDDWSDNTYKKLREISRYAASDFDSVEAIAEALADYYYNRDKAAPLSQALVKRLKAASGTYGINRTGGINLDPSPENFIKNLRRYSAIQ